MTKEYTVAEMQETVTREMAELTGLAARAIASATALRNRYDRLLAAAQALVQEGNEHEHNEDGDRVTTVQPEDFVRLKAVVQEISDEAEKRLREIAEKAGR